MWALAMLSHDVCFPKIPSTDSKCFSMDHTSNTFWLGCRDSGTEWAAIYLAYLQGILL